GIAVGEVLHGIKGMGHKVGTARAGKQVFIAQRGSEACIGNLESAEDSFKSFLSNYFTGNHSAIELVPQLVVDLLKYSGKGIGIVYALFCQIKMMVKLNKRLPGVGLVIPQCMIEVKKYSFIFH